MATGRRTACAGFVAVFVAGCTKGGSASAPEVKTSPRERRCVVRLAAYDIGSATTKVKVADIDRCEDRLVSVLFADDARVFFADDVNGDPPHRFGESIMTRSLEVLRRFSAEAEKHAPEAYAAVATAAFRRAENGSAFAKEIERQVGVPITIIPQRQEAELGFIGAVHAANVDASDAVVWDIGGQSMQLTTLDEDGSFIVFRGRLASTQMRDYILRDVQKRSLQTESPNPIEASEADQALSWAQAQAKRTIPSPIASKLKQAQTQVVGIGALKYYGDRPAGENGAQCALDELRSSAAAMFNKDDDDIEGPYAATQVSDRLLIAGFMRGLGLKQLRIVDVDLTDGMFFSPEFWPKAVR